MLNKYLLSTKRHLVRCPSVTGARKEPLTDMISEKMGLAKGEISEKDLGNPPHEDDAPAPKKEDAPHHGIPQPEKNPGEKEAGRERHEKESKGHTEVEEEHKRGIYDSPSGGAL
jgi:hypothetical protein